MHELSTAGRSCRVGTADRDGSDQWRVVPRRRRVGARTADRRRRRRGRPRLHDDRLVRHRRVAEKVGRRRVGRRARLGPVSAEVEAVPVEEARKFERAVGSRGGLRKAHRGGTVGAAAETGRLAFGTREDTADRRRRRALAPVAAERPSRRAGRHVRDDRRSRRNHATADGVDR